MQTIAYFVYGGRREYQLELSYSVLSAMHHLRHTPGACRILLLTDEAGRRDDLPIEHRFFSPAEFACWTRDGRYHHEAKIQALKRVVAEFGGKVALIDTDTFFRQNPWGLFDQIEPGASLMQASDGLIG